MIPGIIAQQGMIPAGTPAASDPHWSNVVLMMGADNDTVGTHVFTDESNSAHTITADNPTVNNTTMLFGNSLYIASGSIQSIDSDDWDFNTVDFTIEMWANFASLPSTFGIIDVYGSTVGEEAWGLYRTGGTLRWKMLEGTTVHQIDYGSWSPSTGVWHHLAIDRNAANTRVYMDGSMLVKDTVMRTYRNLTSPLMIGAIRGFGYSMNGYLDEIRITKGVARYASDAGYTVPSEKFPRS